MVKIGLLSTPAMHRQQASSSRPGGLLQTAREFLVGACWRQGKQAAHVGKIALKIS